LVDQISQVIFNQQHETILFGNDHAAPKKQISIRILSRYHFTHALGFKVNEGILDNWIRCHVCMCSMKQWCRPRTRNFIKLGAPKEQVVRIGLSSKGPWCLAKSFGSQGGLTNAYLKEQGLVSVLALWVAFHYPK
jgi:hypothetical protein